MSLEVGVGDYLSSPTKLWYVESLAGERAVLEDCRTGELVAVPLTAVLALRRVRAG
jgi:hypothetical protein